MIIRGTILTAVVAGGALAGGGAIQASAQQPYWKPLPIQADGPSAHGVNTDSTLVSCEKHRSRIRITVSSAAAVRVRSVVAIGNEGFGVQPNPQIYTNTAETVTQIFKDPRYANDTSCQLIQAMQWF